MPTLAKSRPGIGSSKASCIAAGPRQTFDHPCADGIVNLYKYDWHRACGLQQRLQRRASGSQNHIGSESWQFGSASGRCFDRDQCIDRGCWSNYSKKPPQEAAWEVSMANLHETKIPERQAQIDTVGWLFVAGVVVITAIAAMVAYNANDVTVATTAASHVAAQRA